MKRPAPNSGVVYGRDPQQWPPIVVNRPSLHNLPLDLILIICESFGLKKTQYVFQTSRYIYYPARAHEPYWERVFSKYFSSPRIKPHKPWRKECEEQCRSEDNIIKGLCVLSEYKVDDKEGKIACFARDGRGRFIIGFNGGKITVCDPKTNVKDVLRSSSNDALDIPKKIVTLDGLCAVQYEKKVCVLDLATKEITFSFEAEEAGKKIGNINLVDEQLIVEVAVETSTPSKNDSLDNPTCSVNEAVWIINIFDLKSQRDPIIFPLAAPSLATTLHGKTLGFSTSNTIFVWDLESNRRRAYHPLKQSMKSLEMDFFPENPLKSLLVFSAQDSATFRLTIDNVFASNCIYLWESPGIPFGFQCRMGSSVDQSTKVLSFLFSKCLPQAFIYWDSQGKAPFENFLSQKVSLTGSYAFKQRKLSFPNENHNGIISLDFTASKEKYLKQIAELRKAGDETSIKYAEKLSSRMPQPVLHKSRPVSTEEILGQIARMLETGDKTLANDARGLFTQLPKSIQEAIWKIYDEKCPKILVPIKPTVDVSALLGKAAEALKGSAGGQLLLQNLTLAAAGHANNNLSLQPVVKEEQGTNLVRLKEAILHYLDKHAFSLFYYK